MPDEVAKIARKYMNSPEEVSVGVNEIRVLKMLPMNIIWCMQRTGTWP